MQILTFLVYSSSVVITENNGWKKGTDIFRRKKSQLTSDSFCIFFPLNPVAKKRKEK